MSEENTDIAAFEEAGLPANVNLGAALAEVVQESGFRSNETFLFCTKGRWNYLDDDDKVTPDPQSQWVVNANSIMRGFICWGPMGTGKVLGERMTGLGQPAVNEGDLPPREYEGEPRKWEPARAFLVKAISGEDEGVQLLFKTNAIGGVNAVNDFVQEISTHFQTDPEAPHPIILLRSSTFDSDYGVQHKPEFKILGWTALGEDAPEPVAVKSASKKKAKKKAATAAATPADDSAGEAASETTATPKRRKRV